MPNRFLLSLLFLLAVVAWPAVAQDISVSAVVSENTIGTQESLSYTLEIQGATFSDVETPDAPETEGLVLQQAIPSTQRNITFVNGALTQSVAFQWSYRPVREGTARIMPISLQVKGRTYHTEEIRVDVVAQSQRPQRPTNRFARPFSNRPAPSTDDDDERSSIAPEDIFIRAVPSARTAYQNEQVTIEYQLFFRNFIQPRHSRLADSWDAEGFWREELEVEARPMPRVTIENGLRYNTITLKRVAVFPARNGELQVDPLRIETEVFAPRGGSDPFSRFFSSVNPYESIERSSPPVTITTKPLPPGAPEHFSGAVGQFDMNTRVTRTEVEVGEPVEIRVDISGVGNVAVLPEPTLHAPGIFEVYDPNVKTNVDNSGRRVRGSKTFTYLLVPHSNGTFEIPPIVFSYFDPQAAQYRTLQSDPLTLTVTGTATVAETSTNGIGLPVGDIAGPLLEANWAPLNPRPLYSNPWTYGLLALPLLLIGFTFGYRRYTTKLTTDEAYARNRRAHPLVRKHLKQADELLGQNEPTLFYAEVERAVLGFVGNRLNVAELGLTRTQLDARLADNGVSEATRADLRRLLETCDLARFAPERPSQAQMETSLDEARRLIVTLDEAFTRHATATAPA